MNDESDLSDKALHKLLIDGDFTATARISEQYFEEIVVGLKRKHAAQYHDLIITAVGDAFLSYFHRPEQYDSEQSGLKSYLSMSANGDFLNLLQKEKRHTEKIDESVELDAEDAEYIVKAINNDPPKEVSIQDSPAIQKLFELFSEPIDREISLLLLDGIRETEAYAIVLGITDKSDTEQQKIVKRHKDRIKKQIQRNIDPSELKDD